MSDYEIKHRFGPIEAVKWWLMRHNTATVRWPREQRVVIEDTHAAWVDAIGPMKITIVTDDPNWRYRPFLEKAVGKLGRDWMWKTRSQESAWQGSFSPGEMLLEIRVHSSKAKWLSILQMKWS